MKKIIFSILTIISVSVIYLYFDEFRHDEIPEGNIVYIVPVYGQSLALGEEALPVTDFRLFGDSTRHHVKTQYLDEKFGYFSNTLLKQRIKRILRSNNRQFETSVYGLGKSFVDANFGDSVYLCTFPAGQGETGIEHLGSNSQAYKSNLGPRGNLRDSQKKKCTINGKTFDVNNWCYFFEVKLNKN